MNDKTKLNLFTGLVVALLLTGLLVTQGVLGSVAPSSCSYLHCIRSPDGNSRPVCFEGEYKPECAFDGLGALYPPSYMPSCLANNVPSAGGSNTQVYNGLVAPAAICQMGLEVCKQEDWYFDSATSYCKVARQRPLCPLNQDYLSSGTGCQPRGGAQGGTAPTLPVPTPDVEFGVNPTPVPTAVVVWPSVTPAASAQAQASASANPSEGVTLPQDRVFSNVNFFVALGFFVVVFALIFGFLQWRRK